MNKIWEFFENMNELVYVTDMDTHELVYMNRKTRESYGFQSIEELVGKKCYEVLQGCSRPCSICNNDELKEGYFKEWECYNPVLDKHLLLKDTMVTDEGRRCRIEIALDNSTQEYQSNMIQRYQNLEALANEGFRLALHASTPDESIEVLMEYIGKALNGERTYIFERNKDGCDDNTYEWVANGVIPQKDNLQNLPPEICARWYQEFKENKNIKIKNVEEIREESPVQYQILKQQKIQSLVVVPLYDDTEVIGFFGVDNLPSDTLEYARNMLQIMAHFIISSIKRRELVKELKSISYQDRLTKFGNRFAMDNYLSNMKEEDSIGVVYCDITGLKRVNDTQGHIAGDRLITDACDCLIRVLGEYGLFRIGGDELLVLCSGITEDELKNGVELLKKDMEEHSVTMALGTVWEADSRKGKSDFDSLLTEAERLMYQDKEYYYKTSGLKRRK